METVISQYTRAQAIEDGVLIDVSKMAKEAGFTIPVAVTAAVWNEHIVPTDKLHKGYGQSCGTRCTFCTWPSAKAMRLLGISITM